MKKGQIHGGLITEGDEEVDVVCKGGTKSVA